MNSTSKNSSFDDAVTLALNNLSLTAVDSAEQLFPRKSSLTDMTITIHPDEKCDEYSRIKPSVIMQNDMKVLSEVQDCILTIVDDCSRVNVQADTNCNESVRTTTSVIMQNGTRSPLQNPVCALSTFDECCNLMNNELSPVKSVSGIPEDFMRSVIDSVNDNKKIDVITGQNNSNCHQQNPRSKKFDCVITLYDSSESESEYEGSTDTIDSDTSDDSWLEDFIDQLISQGRSNEISDLVPEEKMHRYLTEERINAIQEYKLSANRTGKPLNSSEVSTESSTDSEEDSTDSDEDAKESNKDSSDSDQADNESINNSSDSDGDLDTSDGDSSDCDQDSSDSSDDSMDDNSDGEPPSEDEPADGSDENSSATSDEDKPDSDDSDNDSSTLDEDDSPDDESSDDDKSVDLVDSEDSSSESSEDSD